MENTSRKLYIGIDNGSTGTIGLISGSDYAMHETPVEKRLNYTKKKQFISMLKVYDFQKIIYEYMDQHDIMVNQCMAVLERPLVNPNMFTTTLNAVRLLQAQITLLEMMDIPYQFIDSREWQRVLLPEGIKGTPELKLASKDIGIRLFPNCRALITKHKDADGILIAEYAKRKGF